MLLELVVFCAISMIISLLVINVATTIHQKIILLQKITRATSDLFALRARIFDDIAHSSCKQSLLKGAFIVKSLNDVYDFVDVEWFMHKNCIIRRVGTYDINSCRWREASESLVMGNVDDFSITPIMRGNRALGTKVTIVVNNFSRPIIWNFPCLLDVM